MLGIRRLTVRSHQIAKQNPYFSLQQDNLKKQFFFKAGKGKAVEGKISIHITTRITKLLVPDFYKYSIGTR